LALSAEQPAPAILNGPPDWAQDRPARLISKAVPTRSRLIDIKIRRLIIKNWIDMFEEKAIDWLWPLRSLRKHPRSRCADYASKLFRGIVPYSLLDSY
jgi:hypothetical protein